MQVIHPVDEQILRTLLDLAKQPRDVKTTTHLPTLAVVVPDYLFEMYQRYQALESSPPEVPKKSRSKS